jgi:hypothetical protein
MTKHDTIPQISPRLRPDSERALRQLRLVWLLGWTVPDIAAWLQVGPATVYRRVQKHGLNTPAAPGEIDSLIAGEVRDQSGNAMLASNDPLAKELVTILGKLNAARPRASDKKTIKDENGTYTDDREDELIDEIEALAAMESALETPGFAGDSSEGLQENRGIETKSRQTSPLPPARPPYTGSAAGPLADMVAFGGTWRRQDAGRGGMGPLGGAAGGLPPGGAGRAELLGCPRSDDRGPERPDLDLGEGGPPGLATLPPPA